MQISRWVLTGIAGGALVLAFLQLPFFLAMPAGPVMVANALVMAGSATALFLLHRPRAVEAHGSTATTPSVAREALATVGLLLFTLVVLLVGGLGLLFTFG